MGCGNNYYRPSPCPVCKTRSAVMGNSRWAYNGLVCSDECDEKANAAIWELEHSPEFRRLFDKQFDIKCRLAELRQEAIDAIYPDRVMPADPHVVSFEL